MKRIILVRRVVGKSMLPVLRPGQVVVASGIVTKLQPEQVVIFRHRGVDKVKRIKRINNRKIFVEGDNKSASTDSRSFGWLPLNSIVGLVVWPRS